MEALTNIALRWGRPDGVLVSRAAVVEEARSWLGTPFMHQQNMKGVGCDCGGLMRGVSMALGLIPENFVELLPPGFMGYASVPDGHTAQAACDYFLTRIDEHEIRAGDFILMRWKEHPQHSGIVGTDGQSLIHALGPGHPNKVIESPMRWLTMDLRNGPKFVQAYHLPGVA